MPKPIELRVLATLLNSTREEARARRDTMLTVADVMTTHVFTIRSSAKVTQAIALMQEKQV